MSESNQLSLQNENKKLYIKIITVMQQLLPQLLTELSLHDIDGEEFVKRTVDAILFMTSLNGVDFIVQIGRINALLAEIKYLRSNCANSNIKHEQNTATTTLRNDDDDNGNESIDANMTTSNLHINVEESAFAKLLSYFIIQSDKSSDIADKKIVVEFLDELQTDPEFLQLVKIAISNGDASPTLIKTKANQILNYIKTMNECQARFKTLRGSFKQPSDAAQYIDEIKNLKKTNTQNKRDIDKLSRLGARLLEYVKELPSTNTDVQAQRYILDILQAIATKNYNLY